MKKVHWVTAIIALPPLRLRLVQGCAFLPVMPKCGGKGNAFEGGEPPTHCAQERAHAERLSDAAASGRPEDERAIVALLSDLPAGSRRIKEVRRELGTTLVRARTGQAPVISATEQRDCSGCNKHGGTHHFLCSKPDRKFKDRTSKTIYLQVVAALRRYSEKQRLAEQGFPVGSTSGTIPGRLSISSFRRPPILPTAMLSDNLNGYAAPPCP